MPNHVTNILTFSGNKKTISKLLKDVSTKESDFDFNTFFPMPKELRIVSSPTRIVNEKEYREYIRKKEAGELNEFFDSCGPITQKMSNEYIEKYGCDNWYDWAVKNWGTKWGAYDAIRKGDTITFFTAWATPALAIAKLSYLYPNIKMKIEYADEDFGNNVGEYIFHGGVMISGMEYFGSEAEHKAEQILGYSPDNIEEY